MGSLVSSDGSQLYTAGAPRFNHSGKVIVFTLEDSGGLRVLKALLGEQVQTRRSAPAPLASASAAHLCFFSDRFLLWQPAVVPGRGR